MCAYMQNKNEKNYYKQRFITVQIYWIKAISKKPNLTNVLWPLYKSTCINRHLQLITRGFGWSTGKISKTINKITIV